MTLVSRARKLSRVIPILVAAVGVVGCAEVPGSEEALDEGAVEDAQEALFWCRPQRVVEDTLECIVAEDAECAASGYAEDFVKLHNGRPTAPVATADPEFWAGAFQIIDIAIDTNHAQRVGWPSERKVSIRYVETVTTILGDVILQHEHALVTVDHNCQMVRWDQYGDDAEQQAVDDAVARILALFGS